MLTLRMLTVGGGSPSLGTLWGRGRCPASHGEAGRGRSDPPHPARRVRGHRLPVGAGRANLPPDTSPQNHLLSLWSLQRARGFWSQHCRKTDGHLRRLGVTVPSA